MAVMYRRPCLLLLLRPADPPIFLELQLLLLMTLMSGMALSRPLARLTDLQEKKDMFTRILLQGLEEIYLPVVVLMMGTTFPMLLHLRTLEIFPS